MIANTQKPHILACIDGSQTTESVCDHAAWYANQLSLPVALLHTSELPSSTRQDWSGAIGVNSREFLLEELTEIDEQRAKVINRYSNALIDDAKQYIKTNYHDVEVLVYQRHGKLLPAIEHFGETNRVIVMGRRGEDHRNSRLNIGSQIETVARAVHTPVFICSETFSTPQSYMIAFDAGETAQKIIKVIQDSPLLRDLAGHIVMIGRHNDAAKERLEEAGRLLKMSGFRVQTHHLPDGVVVDGLLSFQVQNNIDILVIGAYGHSKWQQFFLGSSTTEIIASTFASVILVR